MNYNWASKTAVFGLAILAVFLGWQKYKQYGLQKAIQAEKTSLQSQLNELEGKNQELTETLGYLNSSSYKELIARQQLNMQKQGELVYNFSDEKIQQSAQPLNPTAESNMRKWLNYFFNRQKNDND
ncbi:MAG: septum formation initiator family protein [Candidatus Doudnabacteria bacterium]|nr:septum formation initiator family protein [Candidatus Doudnabacteria bacterium]